MTRSPAYDDEHVPGTPGATPLALGGDGGDEKMPFALALSILLTLAEDTLVKLGDTEDATAPVSKDHMALCEAYEVASDYLFTIS